MIVLVNPFVVPYKKLRPVFLYGAVEHVNYIVFDKYFFSIGVMRA